MKKASFLTIILVVIVLFTNISIADGPFFGDFFYFSTFAGEWKTCVTFDPCNLMPGDIVPDGCVNIYDLEYLCDSWLDCLVWRAVNPLPSDKAIDVNRSVVLQWSRCENCSSYDIYIGTDFNKIKDSNESDTDVYMGNQDANFWDTNQFGVIGLDLDITYYWRIDQKALGCISKGKIWSFTTDLLPPGPASSPIPENESTDMNVTLDLSWSAGIYSKSHDVYFGTTNPPQFRQNQTGTTYNTGTLDTNTIYYWRIDENNSRGTTTGYTWMFKTIVQLPGHATYLLPNNESTGVYVVTDLLWTSGNLAVSHDVYFGTTNPPPFIGNQQDTTYDTNIMDTNTTYYWRIDEKNNTGITAGEIWSFTTDSKRVVDDTNLQALWGFDEGTGTIAHDSKGSKDGTLVNGPVWATGLINGGISFDGTNDYISLPVNSPVWLPRNDFTAAAWVESHHCPNGSFIFDLEFTFGMDIAYSTGIGLYLLGGPDDSLYFSVTTTNAVNVINTVSISNSTWTHVVAVRKGTLQMIYLNGILNAWGNCSGDPIRYSGFSYNDDKVAIGGNDWVMGLEGLFLGRIDDVRIYNRALDDDEIMLLYQQVQ